MTAEGTGQNIISTLKTIYTKFVYNQYIQKQIIDSTMYHIKQELNKNQLINIYIYCSKMKYKRKSCDGHTRL